MLNIQIYKIINQIQSLSLLQDSLWFPKVIMKKLINPTTFFFQQAQHQTNHHNSQIEQFIGKLINFQKCQLCKNPYDLSVNKPRIMIHCGHTFCTPCLIRFYSNRRVRCPMCLKLVKQIDSIDRLPLNHSIIRRLVEKQNQQISKGKQQKNQGNKLNRQKRINQVTIKDADMFLYSQFQKTQKEALLRDNPQKIDPVSNLPFCVFHPDRVQHFHCLPHNASGCRICMQVGHSKTECQYIDLYNDSDPRVIKLLLKSQKMADQRANQYTNYGIMDLQPQFFNKLNLGQKNARNNLGLFQQKTPRMQQYQDPMIGNSMSQDLSSSLPDTIIQRKDSYPINWVNNCISQSLPSDNMNSLYEDQHHIPQFGIKTHSEVIYGSNLQPEIDIPPKKIERNASNHEELENKRKLLDFQDQAKKYYLDQLKNGNLSAQDSQRLTNIIQKMQFAEGNYDLQIQDDDDD